MATYFVSGIDTSCGKTYATGVLAKKAMDNGRNVITQKFVQTGCEGLSEDIASHRKAMGIPPTPEDIDGTTCPYIFKFPASPHLAAKLEGKTIDPSRIAECTRILEGKYDDVFIEGAGGLMVPVCDGLLTIDYVAKNGLPLILVASAKLGSINHALLSIEACVTHGIRLSRIVYNNWPEEDPLLAEESRRVIFGYAKNFYPEVETQDVF